MSCTEAGVLLCDGEESEDCLDEYRSLHIYYLVGATCSFCGSLFVILTYLFCASLRRHPSVIIFGRSIFDCGFSLSFIVLYFYGRSHSGLSDLKCGGWSCSILGPFNVFVFLCSEGYFLSLLIDLYLSISNPFLNAAHYTKVIRLSIIIGSLCCVIIVHIFHGYDYNLDLEYCTIGPTEKLSDWNMFNWIFIFGPTLICMTAPWIVTFYAFNRLTNGLPNTFFIRIKALKDTLVYCVVFTIYFFLVGSTYFVTWNKNVHNLDDELWYKIHAISSSSLGVIDFIVWTSRKCNKLFPRHINHEKHIKKHNELLEKEDIAQNSNNRIAQKKYAEMNAYPIAPHLIYHAIEDSDDDDDNNIVEKKKNKNKKNNKKHHHIHKHRSNKKENCCRKLLSSFGVHQDTTTALINKALRREVVAYTTDGIAQSVVATRQLFNISTNNFDDIKAAYYPRQFSVNLEIANDDIAIDVVRVGDKPLNVNPLNARKFKISIKHNVELLKTNNKESDSNNNVSGRFCFCFNLKMNRRKDASRSVKERLFTDYAPLIFQYVRNHIIGISDDDYISSIIPSNPADQLKVLDVKYGEGKSGAFFYFSWDSKFIVKTVTKNEVKYLLSFLEAYVAHLEHNRNTILSRIVGIHSCKFYNIVKHFVVMENVFLADLKPNEVYDLKGSWIGRSSSKSKSNVMKDQDLKRYIILNNKTRRKIISQLENDTKFLCENNIIDYSLLLGIYYMKIAFDTKSSAAEDHDVSYNDEDASLRADYKSSSDYKYNNEYIENGGDVYGGVRSSLIEGPGIYYFGIIDAIQKYTFRKKCETWFKRYILRKDPNGISCVEPHLYKKRFMKYMKNIIISNDKWHQESNICMNRFGEERVSIYPSRNLYFDSMKNVRQKRMASVYSQQQSSRASINIANYNEKNKKKSTSLSVHYAQQIREQQFNTFTSTPIAMEHVIHEDEELFIENHQISIDIHQSTYVCDQCQKQCTTYSGKTDDVDGNWYCNMCWDRFYE